MVFNRSGRMIKYLFYSKGIKDDNKFTTASVERFYKKLDKAKKILENARPTAAHERSFCLAMDRFDTLLCEIERCEISTMMSEEDMLREAMERLAKKKQWKAEA